MTLSLDHFDWSPRLPDGSGLSPLAGYWAIFLTYAGRCAGHFPSACDADVTLTSPNQLANQPRVPTKVFEGFRRPRNFLAVVPGRARSRPTCVGLICREVLSFACATRDATHEKISHRLPRVGFAKSTLLDLGTLTNRGAEFLAPNGAHRRLT